jgi:hypothetical protein
VCLGVHALTASDSLSIQCLGSARSSLCLPSTWREYQLWSDTADAAWRSGTRCADATSSRYAPKQWSCLVQGFQPLKLCAVRDGPPSDGGIMERLSDSLCVPRHTRPQCEERFVLLSHCRIRVDPSGGAAYCGWRSNRHQGHGPRAVCLCAHCDLHWRLRWADPTDLCTASWCLQCHIARCCSQVSIHVTRLILRESE